VSHINEQEVSALVFFGQPEHSGYAALTGKPQSDYLNPPSASPPTPVVSDQGITAFLHQRIVGCSQIAGWV